MAQNDLKPNYSSSSEEEEDDEEEATGSEDEQTSGSETDEVSDSDSGEKSHKKDRKKTLISPPPQSASKPQPAPALSSSESEESGSETDSETPIIARSVADPNIKPISSKPMEREGANVEVKLAKKSGSKTSSTPPPAKTKRPPPTPPAAIEKEAKKAKNTATDEDSKKQLFQRLWSEDDEIVILKGMIDYKTEKNGENPVNDMGAFHEFIKKSLHVDVSRAQLVDKVRRLKKKYVNNASREKNGKDRSFSKSHEQKGYELSKLIWGSNSDNTGNESKKKQKQKNGNAASSPAVTVPKSNGVDDKDVSMMEVEKKIDIAQFVQFGRNNDSPILLEEILKAGVELAKGSEREELEERLKELKKQELELFVKRMDLMKEQAVRLLEAVNSSEN